MRAVNSDELTEMFLDEVRRQLHYWRTHPGDDDKLDGLAFSILALLDGCSSLPAFDIAARPHPDDKKYHIDNDENWIESGTILGTLHDRLFN